MAGGIFLNYRREDSASATLLLFTNLKPEFGLEKLFIDVDHISAGADFVQVLDAEVSQCDVMLSIIGPNWLSVIDQETGQRRLDNPDDFVRIEIEAALERDILIIPVLVDNAEFPKTSDLPPSLQPLARRNFIRLTIERYAGDCQALIKDLKAGLAQAEEVRQEQERQRLADEQQAKTAQDEERRRQEDQARQSAHAGLSSEEIRMAEELANWKFVDNSPTEALLRDHLMRFPNGTTKMMARTTLDRVVWQRVSQNPELEPLKGYLSEFPKGEKAVEARTILKTVTAREDALREQHQRLAREEAAQKEKEAKQAAEVERLRREEEAEWFGIINEGGFAGTSKIDDIKGFIKKWPKGAYVKEAKQHLRAAKREYRELTGGSWFSNFFEAIPPFVGAFVLTAILASVAVAVAHAIQTSTVEILTANYPYFYLTALLVGLLIGLILFIWTDLTWQRVLFGAVLSALGWLGIGYTYSYMLNGYFGWYYQDYAFYQFLSGVCAAFAILIGPLIVFSQARQINLRQGVLLLFCLIAGGLSHLYMWQLLMYGLQDILGEDAGATLSPLLANSYFISILLFAPLMACIALLCSPRETYSSDDWGGTEAYASAGLGSERHTEAGPLRKFFARFPAWLIVFIVSGVLGGTCWTFFDINGPNIFLPIVTYMFIGLMVCLILSLRRDLTIGQIIIGAILSVFGALVAVGFVTLLGNYAYTYLNINWRLLIFGFMTGVGLLTGPLYVCSEARVMNERQVLWGSACVVLGMIGTFLFHEFNSAQTGLLANDFILGAVIFAPLMACLSLFSTPGTSRDFRFSEYDY